MCGTSSSFRSQEQLSRLEGCNGTLEAQLTDYEQEAAALSTKVCALGQRLSGLEVLCALGQRLLGLEVLCAVGQRL